MSDARWIAEGLKLSGKKKGDLAQAMRVRPGAISEILAGERQIKLSEAVAAAAFLNVDLPTDIVRTRTVRLVGYVGAGAAMILFSEGQMNDEVDAPEGANASTVAVEIRGTSLGEVFDRWLVFYDEVRGRPTDAMIGRLCVVGLVDGRVLVKKIRRGRLPHCFDLLSNTEPPIYDEELLWAAVVKQMTPR